MGDVAVRYTRSHRPAWTAVEVKSLNGGLGWRLRFWLLLFSVVVGEEVGLRYWILGLYSDVGDGSIYERIRKFKSKIVHLHQFRGRRIV